MLFTAREMRSIKDDTQLLSSDVAQRSEMDVFNDVCLFVNTIFRKIYYRMMKLGVRCIVQKCRPSSNSWVMGPTPGSLEGIKVAVPLIAGNDTVS